MRWYWKYLRRQLVVVGLLVGTLAALASIVVPLYVIPAQQPPQHSDVVFVIGPPDQWRIDWAEQLIKAGKVSSDTLLISVPAASSVPECVRSEPFTVLCHRPTPFTTRGEARWLRSEMAAHGWRTATVITVTTHVTRTRVRMDRCIPRGVQVVGRSTGLNGPAWIYQVMYQTAGWLKVAFQRSC